MIDISVFIIPCLIFLIIFVGIISRVKVFELFADGAKEGLVTVFNLFPVLLGLFLAVSLLRVSGIISFLAGVFEGFFVLIGVPKELVGLILLKPFSGSASIAIASDIIKEYGVNSFISFIAAIIMGATETIFYAIAVYSGNIKKKISKKVIWLALLGNIIAIILSSFVGRIFF